ncbi:MAG: hypothetical protein WAN43_05570 [Rhodomicrobium sp.]
MNRTHQDDIGDRRNRRISEGVERNHGNDEQGDRHRQFPDIGREAQDEGERAPEERVGDAENRRDGGDAEAKSGVGGEHHDEIEGNIAFDAPDDADGPLLVPESRNDGHEQEIDEHENDRCARRELRAAAKKPLCEARRRHLDALQRAGLVRHRRGGDFLRRLLHLREGLLEGAQHGVDLRAVLRQPLQPVARRPRLTLLGSFGKKPVFTVL